MRVVTGKGAPRLLDDVGHDIASANDFLRAALAHGSPNTAAAYAYDLKRFFEFLARSQLTVEDVRPRQAVEFLVYLRELIPRRSGRSSMSGSAPALAPATINRILAAISSFYDHLIITEAAAITSNPLETAPPARTPGPRFRSLRRHARLRRIERLPRPLSEAQVTQLLLATCSRRDTALILLMLQGGLRVGEVLNLRLEDIQYGRRRILVRHGTDHPKGARSKSRSERVIDLHEPETLAAVSAYITHERPRPAIADYVFLAGGRGATRGEPIGYAALAKWFQRRKRTAGLTEPWMTLHCLRHTHATRMWEGGMSEFCLQKRLGHASFESTRVYTRVSDTALVADYRKALQLGPVAS